MNDVNQNSTGYDAPGNGTGGATNHRAYDKRVDGRKVEGISRTIVEFPGMDNVRGRAEANANPANIYNAARYVAETVNINLGTVTVPKGQAVELP